MSNNATNSIELNAPTRGPLGHLDELARAWQATGQEPPSAACLPAEEYRALCVAVGRPQMLLNPVIDFQALPSSLRDWALDFFRDHHRGRGYDGFRQMCEWANERAPTSHAGLLERLAAIANDWRVADAEPESAGALSSGEYVAVCLAAGRPAVLKEPVAAFLRLDGWLQAWVLQQRGLSAHVGDVVGHPCRW